MACITADGFYSVEGFIGNLSFLYNQLECSANPLTAVPTGVPYEQFLFHLCSCMVVLPSIQWCGPPHFSLSSAAPSPYFPYRSV